MRKLVKCRRLIVRAHVFRTWSLQEFCEVVLVLLQNTKNLPINPSSSSFGQSFLSSAWLSLDITFFSREDATMLHISSQSRLHFFNFRKDHIQVFNLRGLPVFLNHLETLISFLLFVTITVNISASTKISSLYLRWLSEWHPGFC